MWNETETMEGEERVAPQEGFNGHGLGSPGSQGVEGSNPSSSTKATRS